jgi:hypothetical protein
MESILSVKEHDVVKYTKGETKGWSFQSKDMPPRYNSDDPFGIVVTVRNGAIPSVKVLWCYSGIESWVFRSSLEISSEAARKSHISWARSYYEDSIRDAQRRTDYALDRLMDLPSCN